MVTRPKFHGQKMQVSRERYTESVIVPTDGMGHYGAKPWPFDYRRAVEQAQGWVYRCVMGNAQTAAAVPLRLFVRKRSAAQLKALGLGPATYTSRPVTRSRMKYLTGDRRESRPSNAVLHKMSSFGDDFEEVQDHPVLDVLRTVNPMLNGFELATFRHVYLQLTGNAYLHPVMSPTLMRPVELWPMPTDWTRIIPGDPGGTEMVKGYVFGDGYTREQTFEADEVLHFAVNRYVRDAHYGYGPMEAAWPTVGLSVSKRISDKALFDNMSRPDYVLSIEGASADEAQRTDARINALHRGVRKVGRALVTTGRAKVQPLQFPPKDVGEFSEILEEIAGIFGYPIQKLRSSYEPKANAEIADYGWMKDTILPMLRNDEEALNQGGFLGLFGDGALLDDVVLAYDDPVPENAESARNDAQTYVTGGVWTINDERDRQGLPPVEGGDVPRINGVAIEALDAQAMAQAEMASQPFGVISPPQPPTPAPPPEVDVSEIARQVVAAMNVSKALEPAPAPQPVAHKSQPEYKNPAKYDDINFKPTRSMADAAQQGLDYRDEYGRGGTEVGIARARDISNRENLSPETVGRMVSFFARHADNRNPDAEESDGGPSNGWIAWLLWGGDPGKAWADKVAAQMDAADDDGSPDDGDKRSKAQGGDVDAGDQVDSEGVAEADESGAKACGDQGEGEIKGNENKLGDGDGQQKREAQTEDEKTKSDTSAAATEPPKRLGIGDGKRTDGQLAGGVKLDNGDADHQSTQPGNATGDDHAGGCGAGCSCKTYTPDEPEGDDIAEAVKKYGPDAAYMPIGFKGYGNWKSNADGEATGEADDTARGGEPETPINRMARLMADAFKEQEAAVLDAMKGMKAKRRTKADINDNEDRLALIEAAKQDPRVLRILEALSPDPLARAAAEGLPPMFAAGAQSGADAIGMSDGSGGTPNDPGSVAGGAGDPSISVGFDVSNPLVERAARERSIELAGDLNQTTINRLRDSLADGIASGESTAKLTQRVREQFESFSDSRAEAVARTESAMAYEKGQQDVWTESGVVEGKQWLLAPGACPWCVAVAKEFEGKQVALNGVFVPKGSSIVANGKPMKVDYRDIDGPPLHPNDRCDLIPVLGGEFKSLDEAIKKNDTNAIKKFWTDRRANHQDFTDDNRDA